MVVFNGKLASKLRYVVLSFNGCHVLSGVLPELQSLKKFPNFLCLFFEIRFVHDLTSVLLLFLETHSFEGDFISLLDFDMLFVRKGLLL
jgi:hypothetical protein